MKVHPLVDHEELANCLREEALQSREYSVSLSEMVVEVVIVYSLAVYFLMLVCKQLQLRKVQDF